MQPDLFQRDLTPDTVLAALQDCVGEANGRTAEQLVHTITGRTAEADKRRLRQVIEALRTAGHPVCGQPALGYFLAANAAELDRGCVFLVGRSMTTLRQVCAMKRVALPDLRGQLGLPLENQP
jgi:hypothetical protein